MEQTNTEPDAQKAATAVSPDAIRQLVACLHAGAPPKELRRILQANPGIANSKDDRGYPILLYAFKKAAYLPVGGPTRNGRAVQILLREGGADPNVSINGTPLLILLCENKATRNIEALLDNKANPNVLCPVTGNNPLLALLASTQNDTKKDGVAYLLRAGVDCLLKNKKGEDAIDLSFGTCFSEIVKHAPSIAEGIPKERLMTLMKKLCTGKVYALADFQTGLRLMDTRTLLEFLEFNIGLGARHARPGTYITLLIHEYVAREKKENSTLTVGQILSDLYLPNLAMPVLHAMLETHSMSDVIHALLVWFASEGVNLMKPCELQNRTAYDLCKTTLFLAKTDASIRFKVGMFVQSDPNLLNDHPEILKAIPAHDLVAQRIRKIEAQTTLDAVVSGSFPLTAFLPQLPHDLLCEILQNCNVRDVASLAVSCSSMNRFISSDKSLWRRLANNVAPHRISLVKNPNEQDWRSMIHGAYKRTRGFLNMKKSKPRAVRVESQVDISSWYGVGINSPAQNRLFIKKYNEAQLLDVSGSSSSSEPQFAKQVGVWKFKRMFEWDVMLDYETVIVGSNPRYGNTNRVEEISIFKSCLNNDAAKAPTVTFTVEGSSNHYYSCAALSSDKRRIFIYSSLIIDLEHQCAIARMNVDRPSSGAVTASPFNPDIFVSASNKIQVIDVRTATVGGSVVPVLEIPLQSTINFAGANVALKDENTAWVGAEKLLSVDLRSREVKKYFPAPAERGYAKNVLFDPIECRAVFFTQCDNLPPIVCRSDLSGTEWTHTYHSGVFGASAANSTLSSTQLISLPSSSSVAHIYDL